MPTTTLIGISGSLRRASYNSTLLRALASMAPAGTDLRVESIAGIPLYNGDDEAQSGIPPAVARLKEAIAGADGLLLVTPEYNNSIPGVAKNAIDWLSRPVADIGKVFGGKPVAIAGASPGGFGTILSQSCWLPVLRTLGTDLWTAGKLYVSHAASAFDANGGFTDPAVRDVARKFVEGFAAYVEVRRASRSRSL